MPSSETNSLCWRDLIWRVFGEEIFGLAQPFDGHFLARLAGLFSSFQWANRLETHAGREAYFARLDQFFRAEGLMRFPRLGMPAKFLELADALELSATRRARVAAVAREGQAAGGLDSGP